MIHLRESDDIRLVARVGNVFIPMPPESNVEEMAKIVNNKVRLHKTDIDVTEVLNWMAGMGVTLLPSK